MKILQQESTGSAVFFFCCRIRNREERCKKEEFQPARTQRRNRKTEEGRRRVRREDWTWSASQYIEAWTAKIDQFWSYLKAEKRLSQVERDSWATSLGDEIFCKEGKGKRMKGAVSTFGEVWTAEMAWERSDPRARNATWAASLIHGSFSKKTTSYL